MAKSRGLNRNISAALVLGALIATGASAAPVLSLSPSPTSPTVGGVLTLNVLITGVTDLYAFNYTINFNPASIQVTGSTTEGSFLGTGGSTYYIPGAVDNTLGTYSFSGSSLVSAAKGVTGSGVLEKLTFAVSSAAPSTFSFSDVTFLDSNFATITMSPLSLTVSPVPEPESYALLALGLTGLAVWRRRSVRVAAKREHALA